MKKNFKKLAALLVVSAFAVSASASETFNDTAQVISSTPQFAQSGGCNNGQNRGSEGSSINAGSILGAVVGGAVGHQLKGNQQTTATALGAAVGAITGNNLAKQQGSSSNYGDCGGGQITGYKVTYVYHNIEKTELMQSEPGQTIPVRVMIDFRAQQNRY